MAQLASPLHLVIALGPTWSGEIMTVYAYNNGYRLRRSGRFGYTVYDPKDFYVGYAEFGHFETIDKMIADYERKENA